MVDFLKKLFSDASGDENPLSQAMASTCYVTADKDNKYKENTSHGVFITNQHVLLTWHAIHNYTVNQQNMIDQKSISRARNIRITAANGKSSAAIQTTSHMTRIESGLDLAIVELGDPISSGYITFHKQIRPHIETDTCHLIRCEPSETKNKTLKTTAFPVQLTDTKPYPPPFESDRTHMLYESHSIQIGPSFSGAPIMRDYDTGITLLTAYQCDSKAQEDAMFKNTGSPNVVSPKFYAPSHEEVVAFVNEHYNQLTTCEI